MATQPAMFPELTGPDFVKSDEVQEVGEWVLAHHGGVGGVPRIHPIAEAVRDGELTILWLANDKPFIEDSEDDDEPEIAGRCVKAPKLWRDITGYTFAIWTRSHFWDQMSVDDRRALVLHELLHVEVKRDKDGQAKFSTRKHDVEDFVDVARTYGPAALAGDGARYVRAAAAFAGEPAPITSKRRGKGPRTVDPSTADLAHEVVDAVVNAEGLNEEVRAQAHADVDAAAAELPDVGDVLAGDALLPEDVPLQCVGSNHVPGHTAGCPKWVAPCGAAFGNGYTCTLAPHGDDVAHDDLPF